jgi:hypothetical protein
MRVMRQLAVLLLLVLTSAGVRAGEVIDQIVATVGRHAILQSEMNEAVRFEAFAAGRSLASVTAEDVKSALNRMVDQQLIHDEMGKTETFAPSSEAVNKKIEEIRAEVPGGATDEGWRSILSTYGLSAATLAERIRMQLETLNMMNQRLRPSVRVDQAEIEAAYRDEFLPKLRQAGGKEVPLADVSLRIRQILIERHIDELMDGWLESLRAQSDVRIQLGEAQSAKSKMPASTSTVHQVDSAH